MKLFGKRITEKVNRLAALLIVTAFCLFGCGTSDNDVTHKTEASKNYERVIALSKSNADLWISAGGTLIATSEDAIGMNGVGEDVVSLGHMDHVSEEAVLALEPDLVILFSTDPPQKALGEALESVGVNVYYTNIDTFDDYDAVMRDLTGYTGKPENYEKNVSDVREQIEQVIKDVPEGSDRGTYLFLRVAKTSVKAAKNDYFSCEILNNLGLTNIAEDDNSFDDLSMEAILAADPDYIFMVLRSEDESASLKFNELYADTQGWGSLKAVSEGRYYVLPREHFSLKPNAAWGDAYREAYDLIYGER